MMKWVERALLSVVAVVGMLILVGVTWEQWHRTQAMRDFPPPGELVEVDGEHLHLFCSGEGSPVVVLEGGASMPSVAWTAVQRAVSPHTRVCSYDRVGLGWSYGAEGSADAEAVARRLRSLLRNGQIAPPFVPAGHSIGGAYSLVFADLYGDEVAGLVLVDASHPDSRTRLPAELRPRDAHPALQRLQRIVAVAQARVGLVRFMNRKWRSPDHWPDGVHATGLALTAQGVAAGGRERMAQPEILARAAQVDSLGQIPLVVLTSELPQGSSALSEEQNESYRRLRLEMQSELADLSPNSEHRLVEGSGHMVQLDDPAATAGAILDVVAAVRGARELRRDDR
jgi:pimeloyl-ACP methyl ester carboxylesterase